MNSQRDPISRAMSHWRLRRERGFRLVQRFDPVLGFIALSALIAIVVMALVWGGLKGLSGSSQIVYDNRILGSFTDPGRCFVATATDTQGTVWTSLRPDETCQNNVASGGLAPFDPVWRLWGAESRPFVSDSGRIAPETLAQLDNALWVQGDAGGLAVRYGDEDWHVWLSQSQAINGGSPLDNSDVAAISGDPDDGVFFIATKQGRMFRYAASTGRWDAVGSLPSSGVIRQIIVTPDHLWSHRANTIWRQTRDPISDQLGPPVSIFNGTVQGFKRTETGIYLWTREQCASAGASCTRVLFIEDGGRSPETILDTRAAPIDWTAGDVQYVSALGVHLVLAGPRGIYAYDSTGRAWKALDQRPVDVFAAISDQRVGYGGDGFAGLLTLDRNGALATVNANLPDTDNRISGLAFGDDAQLLVSSDLGSLWRMNSAGQLTQRFAVTAPRTQIVSEAIMSTESTDLFLSQSGAIAFARDTRRYIDSPLTPPLAGLIASDLRHYEGRPVLAATNANGATTGQVISIDIDTLEDAKSTDLPGGQSAISISLLDDDTGVLTTSQDRLYSVSTGTAQLGLRDLTAGQPRSGMNAADLTDITALGSELVLGGTDGIMRYDPLNRSWHRIFDDAVTAVAGSPDAQNLLSARPDGTVYQHDLSARTDRIFLGAATFPFSDDRLVLDGLIAANGDLILLGAKNRNRVFLYRYDPNTRTGEILSDFQAQGPLDGEILDYDNADQWLVRMGANVHIDKDGAQPRGDNTERVITGWRVQDGGDIVTLEKDRFSGLLFLRRTNPNTGQAQCLYRGAGVTINQGTRISALPNGGLAASSDQSLHLYALSEHRWYPVQFPSGTNNLRFVSDHGAIWATSQTSTQQARLWQIPTVPQRRPNDSCDTRSTPVTPRSFLGAAIDPQGQEILHQTTEGAVSLTNIQTGLTETIFNTPYIANIYRSPQRALLVDDVIWLAFSNGVLAYDVETRAWTVMGTVSAADWQQITLEPGTGRLNGKIVASYSTGRLTRQLIMERRSNDGPATSPDVVSRNAPDLAPLRTRGLGDVVDSWSDGGFTVFQFDNALHLLDRRSGNWQQSGHPAGADGFVIGTVSDALVSWNNEERRFYFQRGGTRLDAYRSPRRSNAVPLDATPVITEAGGPAYFTPQGAFFLCERQGACREAVAPAPAFDPDLIRRGFVTEAGFVLIGNEGRATFLFKQSRTFQRIFGPTQQTQSGLQDWLSEPIAALWPQKGGTGYIAQSTDGQVARISQNGPVLARPLTRGLQSPVRLFNPDETIVLTDTGEMAATFYRGQLPEGIAPSEVTGIGRHEDHIWWTSGTEIFHVPQECLSTRSTTDDVAQDCETLSLERPPGGQIAYLLGGWDGEQSLEAQLKNGARYEMTRSFLRGPEWSQIDAPDRPALNVSRDIAPLLDPRPDGQLSLSSSVRVISDAGAISALNVPGIGAVRVVTPDTLSLPALDQGWLRFDRARAEFQIGSQQRPVRLAAAASFHSDGHFLPYQVLSILPQTDGRMLVRTPLGLRLVDQANSVFEHDDTPDFIAVQGPVAANEILDEGGIWTESGFVGFRPAPREADVLRKDAVTLSQNRRRIGSEIRYNQLPAWRPGIGFGWDQVLDVGWTDRGIAMMQTPIGPVAVQNPLAPEVSADVQWSGETFAALRVGNDFTQPAPALRIPNGTQPGVAAVRRDVIFDATNNDRATLVATDFGVQRVLDFEYGSHFEHTNLGITRLDLHRPTGLVVFDDMALVAQGLTSPRPPTRTERSAISDPVEGQIGPLRLIRRDASMRGFDLRLVDSTIASRNGPALFQTGQGQSRLSLDHVEALAIAADQSVVMATGVGFSVSPSGSRALAQVQLTLSSDPVSRLDVAQAPDAIFAIETTGAGPARCQTFLNGRLVPGCPGQTPRSRVTVDTASGVLTTQRAGDLIGFSLMPANIGRQPLPVALIEGRFDHDRMTHVAACHGYIHYFTRAGLHLRQPTASFDWTTATPIARRDTPQRISCPESLDQPGLRENLLVLNVSDRVEANFLDDPEALPFGSSDIFERFLTGPTLTQAPRSTERVLRRDRGNSALVVQPNGDLNTTLTVGGVERSLDLLGASGPAALIDIPLAFASLQGRLWAVTRDGIVPMGSAGTDAQIVLETDGPPIADVPTACSQGPVRTHWVSNDETDLRCGETYFRLSLGADEVLQISTMPRPRLHSAQAGTLFVQARASTGLDRVALAGEILSRATFDGGFRFDTGVQLIPVSLTRIAVASGEGLHLYAGATLSLDTTERAGLISDISDIRGRLPVLKRVRGIEATHASSVACLTLGNSADAAVSFVRFEESNAEEIDWAGSRCVPFHGSDGLREGWGGDTENQPTFALRLADGAVVSDQISNGRFRADMALGLPSQRPLTNRLEEEEAFCAASANPSIAIVGTAQQADRRIATRGCAFARDAKPAFADGTLFNVENGALVRQQR